MSKPKRFLEVTARPKNGFRRAGFRFTEKPTRLDIAELSDEQIEMLTSDPNLVCHEVGEGETAQKADAKDLAAAKKQIETLTNQLTAAKEDAENYKTALGKAQEESETHKEKLAAAEKQIEKLEADKNKSATKK